MVAPMNTDYPAYRARALAYYQGGGVLTTQSHSAAAVRRRAARDARLEAPFSKELQRRIKWLVKSGNMKFPAP